MPGLLAFLTIAIASIASALRAARLYERAGDKTFELVSRSLALGVIALLAADFFITNEYEHLLWLLLALPRGAAGNRPSRDANQRGDVRRRLRVLSLMNAGVSGGAERFAAGLATHMPRDRIDPWMCCTRAGDVRRSRR